jgi:uncharacterized protein (UPF0264 family)
MTNRRIEAFAHGEGDAPGLLVSVRSAPEAIAALEGGADVIDVKEPGRGALGAADAATIDSIVRAVAGRAPVTAALGEVVEFDFNDNALIDGKIPAGIELFKFGLAGCGSIDNWQDRWQAAVKRLAASSPASAARPVAVVYADWQAANAPEPESILQAGVELRCPALLVDTWDKSAGGLFTHWSAAQVLRFVQTARTRQLAIVLAGSLQGEEFVAAARLAPDLLAVRTAACRGGREGTVNNCRVRQLKQCIVAIAHETKESPQTEIGRSNTVTRLELGCSSSPG